MFRSKYTKPRNNTITNDVSNTNLGSNNSQPTIQTSPMASLTNMVPAVAKNEIPTTLSEIIPSSNINTKNLSEKTDKRGFPIPKFSKPLNSMKDSSNFKVDERGFPIPGSFVEKSLSGTKRPTLTIIQGMNKATEDITNAAIHFAVTTGAVGLNKVLDAMAFTLFQLDNLTMNNKEEVLKQLEEKMKLFQYLAHDEKSKEIIRK